MLKFKVAPIILAFVIILTLFLSTSVRNVIEINYYENSIENLIIFIGDGMGENHIKAASVFAERNLSFEDFEEAGFIGTNSLSGITDSAAAATAMATGNKVRNGDISRFAGQDLTTILEIANTYNKKTGVITSDKLYSATPSAFSSHANDRDDTAEIIQNQILSGVDLLIGEGLVVYTDYETEIISNEYSFIKDKDDLSLTDSKILAALPAVEPLETATEESAYLSDLVEFGIDFLTNDNGFVLIIEASDIDKRSHDNDLQGMVYELMTLDSAVSVAREFASTREDTFIMVTADHETGGLSFENNDTFQAIIDTQDWSTTGHTSQNVPYYASGYDISANYLENTNIFLLCDYLVSKRH